ncbi:MAG: S8 family serine peptidase [Candidatus Aenigmarchaeota archaeon]|nr:S8 family serine peptidase [Candidatus Aenigmarchaeota archaeon]
MKNAALFVGLILCLILVTNIVAGKSYDARGVEKLDKNLAVKINETGDETIKVIVWVDREKYDRYKAANAGKIKKEFDIIPAVAMEVKKSKLKELASADFVKKITIDHPVKAFRSNAIPLLRADLAMNTFGSNGTNIKIAIIDTGVFNHSEFQTPNRIIIEKCFTQNKCPPNNTATSSNATDDHGHGTHVAGIAAGEGGSFGRGTAPNASIMAVKVLDSNGDGSDSDIVSGIQWAVDNGAHIISMSLGVTFNQFADCYDVGSSAAVDNATSRGVVVIVAAGNSGPSARTMAAPACAKTSIAVGNTDKTDKIVSGSSRGPTNDNRTKPDLSATGASITSTYPSYLGGNYATASGTSMAAPFVSGIAAMLMQRHNESFGYLPSPGLIKSILINSVNTSNMTIDGFTQRNNNYGAGRLDAYEAVYSMKKSWNESVQQSGLKKKSVFVSSSQFRVTLSWMENSTTKDNLDLIVGNATNNFTNPSDVNDTVEQVFVSNPVSGPWHIYVNGTSVAGSQEYFVAYSGTPVVFSNDKTGKNSGTPYAPRENYSFEINVTGTISPDEISHAIFQLNNTNYTKNSAYQVYNNSAGLFWINITDLPAGIHVYRWFANSSQNEWGSTSSIAYIISKNYSKNFMNLTLNNTNNDVFSPYDYTLNITGWKNFTEGNLTLYRNGSVVGIAGINQPNESVILSGGIYNYTLAFTESENYSFANITRILTVTKRPTSITLLLNGSAANFVYNYSTFANFTATVNISGKNLTLTSNMSGWTDQNATNRVNNETLLNQPGIFNITAYFRGDDNYSASLQMLFATVADIVTPLIVSDATSPDSGIQYFPNRVYRFNATLQDNAGISHAVMQFNATNYTASMFAGTPASGNWSVNITDLAANATGYPVIWYANDTSNNWNKTNAWYYVIQKNTSAYTSISANATTVEIPGPFHINSSSVDVKIETRLYSNTTLEQLLLRNSSIGTNTFTGTAQPVGIYNFSANSSANENYTANATLEHIVFRVVDTSPPVLADGWALPRSAGINRNISVLAISDDYSANTATVNIFNTTNASVLRKVLNYIINVEGNVQFLNRTTFFTSLNTSALNNGLFYINVSFADFFGNAVNYSLGNFTVSSSVTTALFSNPSVPVRSVMLFNLSAEANITLNISSSSDSGITDSLIVAYYANNPSNENNAAVSLSRFTEISVGGWLNQTLTWVEMRMPYTASEIPAGYDENNLRIYYNHPNGSWVLFSGANVGGVNTTDKYVWANSTHFSVYGVFVMPTCSDNIQNQGEGGTDCGGPCVACVSARPPTGGPTGGGSSATTTTTTAITTTTTTTTTTTMFNVSIPPNTTFVIVNDTEKNKTPEPAAQEARDRGATILLLLAAAATVLVAAALGNRKNFKILISKFLKNIKLD